MVKNLLGAMVIALLLAGPVYAQNNPPSGDEPQGQGTQGEHKPRHHRVPPKAAINACSGKSEGDACQFTTPRGKAISGMCHNTRDKKYFACRPKRGPEGQK